MKSNLKYSGREGIFRTSMKPLLQGACADWCDPIVGVILSTPKIRWDRIDWQSGKFHLATCKKLKFEMSGVQGGHFFIIREKIHTLH